MAITYHDLRHFLDGLRSIKNDDELFHLVVDITKKIGFAYFAITEHINVNPGDKPGISLINYPDNWESLFRRKRLFGIDPVHRASETRTMPFQWSELNDIIPMTAQDRLVLELARENGMGDGYTIPASIPGRMIGSCSFGMAGNDTVVHELLPFTAFIGEAVFETARHLRYGRWQAAREAPVLTDRQLDCVALLAQGFTTIEISKMLNVKYETAVQHIKDAADRYGVSKRVAIAIHALLDGSLCFTDVVPPRLRDMRPQR